MRIPKEMAGQKIVGICGIGKEKDNEKDRASSLEALTGEKERNR